MKPKEIEQKFEELENQIMSLTKEHEELYEVTQFILNAMGKYTDEPIFRTLLSPDLGGFTSPHKNFVLQFAHNNRVKEIRTDKDIRGTKLFAYCDTHFILKRYDNKYFLVDMEEKTITDIPTQLLFSKEMKNLTIEGQTLKICHTGPGVIGIRRNTTE